MRVGGDAENPFYSSTSSSEEISSDEEASDALSGTEEEGAISARDDDRQAERPPVDDAEEARHVDGLRPGGNANDDTGTPFAQKGSNGAMPKEDCEDPSCVKADGLAEKDADMDIDSCSDISDNSDLFHVAAKPSEAARTTEDEDLEIIESIAKKLRRYPLLPCVSGNGKCDFTDVNSGMRLPLLHCGFQGSGNSESGQNNTQCFPYFCDGLTHIPIAFPPRGFASCYSLTSVISLCLFSLFWLANITRVLFGIFSSNRNTHCTLCAMSANLASSMCPQTGNTKTKAAYRAESAYEHDENGFL